MEFNDLIQPANLACPSSKKYTDMIAIGNGLLPTNAEYIAPTLQYAHMKRVSKKTCFLYVPTVAFRKGIICAEGKENESICNSGGPLMDASSQNLVGISSFRSLYGCGDKPQAFTRTSKYLQWIEETTGVTCTEI